MKRQYDYFIQYIERIINNKIKSDVCGGGIAVGYLRIVRFQWRYSIGKRD